MPALGEPAAREINQPNEKKGTHKEGHSVNDICEWAGIEHLPDEQLRGTLRSVIERMYAADFITVDGTRIPQEQVRRQLARVNSDIIHHALRHMRDNAGEVTRGSHYLMACLYNAVDDFYVELDIDVARYRASLP